MVNQFDEKPQWGYTNSVEPHRLQTVVETPEFLHQVSHYLPDEARKLFVNYIAAHPQVGDIIKGTGGARKIRWARPGSGKRGGIRVIYYHHNDEMPIFLFTAYGKNERANLSQAERNALKMIIKQLVVSYQENINE